MSLLKPSAKDGKKFRNPVPTPIGGFGLMFKVLPMYFNNREETEPKTPLGPFQTDPQVFSEPPATGLRVTWFGHSAFLLEIDGFRVLADPVWEARASPFRWAGPKRFFPPTLSLQQLPPLDAILISHDHYDHLGAQTVHELSSSAAGSRSRWITSRGVGKRLEAFGVTRDRIAELDWTETVEVTGGTDSCLRITAWPARHFSGRTPWDRMSTLWSSFVFEGSAHRVFYGADSGLWPGFEEIANRHPRFDLSMLEIGAFHPLWASIHLGPDGAAEAYRQMGGPARAGILMPIHWGLFNLALHGWRTPIERMVELASQEGWPLFLPTPGKPTEVMATPVTPRAWWRKFPAAAAKIGDISLLPTQPPLRD